MRTKEKISFFMDIKDIPEKETITIAIITPKTTFRKLLNMLGIGANHYYLVDITTNWQNSEKKHWICLVRKTYNDYRIEKVSYICKVNKNSSYDVSLYLSQDNLITMYVTGNSSIDSDCRNSTYVQSAPRQVCFVTQLEISYKAKIKAYTTPNKIIVNEE